MLCFSTRHVEKVRLIIESPIYHYSINLEYTIRKSFQFILKRIMIEANFLVRLSASGRLTSVQHIKPAKSLKSRDQQYVLYTVPARGAHQFQWLSQVLLGLKLVSLND